MTRVLIIEDEPLAATKIIHLLQEVSPTTQVLAILESVEESIDWLSNNEQPDLILSDIHLNDGLCFSIYNEVKIHCPIIFTTAYEKYAIQAFEVNGIDYLLKPIQKERLQAALDKVKRLDKPTSDPKVYSEIKQMLSNASKSYKNRFLCRIGTKIKAISIDNIMYFFSQDKITFIVDNTGKRYPVNNTLDEIDQMLNPQDFFRVNRKYILRFEAIDEIAPYFKGRLKLSLSPPVEDDIIVSTEKSPIFKSWLNQ